MFSSRVLLLLFGATIASSQFIPKLSMLPSGCPPAPELAPMICKLTQNIGLQYKPQLIAPSTYIPPMVVEKCDTPQLQMEINLPLTVEKKPVVIPAPPVLPPITLPKFPVPVMIEKPIAPPVPIVELCEPALIPEMPDFKIPFPPALTPQDFKPMVIPQPPELPMFVLPELPVRVPEPAMIIEPCPEDQPMQVVPVPEYIKPLVPIPAAPEWPSVTLPERPAHVEIPPQPILPPMIIEQLIEEPCLTGEVVVAQPPAPIPAAPELPPARLPELPVRVEVPNQPIFPPMIIEKPGDEPCITGEVVVAQPLVPIPAVPELPPARLPELPVRVEIPSQPMIIEQPVEEPCITGEIVVPQPLAPLPVAPELPVHFEIPTKPILPPMIVERPNEEPCITGEVVVARPEPILLPPPPKVPHFIMPEPQMDIMKPMVMPIFPSYPHAAVIADPCKPSGQPIVKMAELPPYFVKHLPSHVSINNKKFNEYVLPTMAINGFRPMEKYYVHRV